MVRYTTGDTVLEKYEVIRELGRGGFGTVFQAKHRRLGHTHAIKLIHADRMGRSTVDRFEREIQALANIKHPNVVHAIDAGVSGDDAYIVMEYVDGVPLNELARQRQLSIAEVVEIALQLCEGLSVIHSLSRTHRDIKPSNVMLDRSGTVKILDLGLAKVRSEHGEQKTASGEVMGTPDFMAPEQWEDSSTADIRTDIYSLGCTIYYLLVGGPPFSGPSYDSAPSKMRGHLMQVPDRIERGDCPSDLQQIIDRAMSKAPAERFASPAELAAALEAFRAPADLRAVAITAVEAQPKIDPSLVSSSPAALGSTHVPAASPQLADIVSHESVLPNRQQPELRTLSRPLLIGVLGFGAAVAALMLVPQIRQIVLNKGAIDIEYPADAGDVLVEVLKNGERVRVVAGDEIAELDVGEYGLSLVSDQSLSFESRVVTISRGSTAVVKLTFRATPPPGKVSPRSAERDFAVAALTGGADIWIHTAGGDKHVNRMSNLPQQAEVTTLHLPTTFKKERLDSLMKKAAEAARLSALLVDLPDFDWPRFVPLLKPIKNLEVRMNLDADNHRALANLGVLGDLPNLKSLSVCATNTKLWGDQFVTPLTKCKSLTRLSLAQAAMDGQLLADADIQRLVEHLPELTEIDLSFNTRLGPSGFHALSQLRKLEKLRCHDTPINDDVLPALLEMRHLKELNVRKTSLPLESLRQVLAANPGLNLICDFPADRFAVTSRAMRGPKARYSLTRAFKELRHSAEVTKVAALDFSGSWRIAAGGKDGALYVWAYSTEHAFTQRKLEHHEAIIRAVWPSEDGRRLVTADASGRLLIWRTNDWSIALTVELEADLWDAKFADRDTVVISAADGRLRKVTISTKKVALGPVIGSDLILRELSVIDEKTLVVVGTDGHAVIADTDTLTPGKSQKLSEKILTSVVALGPSRIIVGDWGGRTVVWNPATKSAEKRTETLAVESIAASHTGSRVFVGSMYDSGQILEERTGTHLELIGAHKGTIADAFFIDDETLVTAGFDKAVRVWKLPPVRDQKR